VNGQPIRPYGPPNYLVWITDQPCTTLECAQLTAALATRAAEIIEHGHWGPYNAVMQWRHAETTPTSYLVELADSQPAPAEED